MALPELRALDAFPVDHEGDQYYCLHDPSGMVEDQLFLTGPALFVAAQLTGLTEVRDVQSAFQNQFDGAEISPDRVMEVVQVLDERGFLLTRAFHDIQRNVEESFSSADVRPAHFAGKSYPEDADELRSFLDGQFLRDGGPGEQPKEESGNNSHLPGLIVPHIDFQRGGHGYAHGYLRMSQSGKPDTVFIFGVAHDAAPVPFILTRKNFDTPLGTVETDKECVDTLEQACGWDPYEFELAHRTEHSIEFQAVMLAYLYGPSVRIVPILCSMLSEDSSSRTPEDIEGVQHFLAACRSCVSQVDKRVTVIAAADLAHVGRRFGDPFDISDDIVAEVAKRDTEDLSFVTRNRAADFYNSVMRDDNERNVCGLNCIYATLKTLENVVGGGEKISYDYAHDPAGGIVSFASIALE